MNAKDAAKESSIKAGYNPNIAADAVGQAVYETAFIAGAEWQKQKAIEAFRVMGERTRFDIPTDVLIKAREIFIEELNK